MPVSVSTVTPRRLALHTVAAWLACALVAAFVGMEVGRRIAEWRRLQPLSTARAAVRRHDVAPAIAAYRQFLNIAPGDSAARLELAGLLLKSRRPEDALIELRRIRPESPELPAAGRLVAAISLELGRDYDARGPLEALLERFPKDSGLHQAYSEICYRSRDYELALQHARQCRQLDPTSVASCLLEAEASDSLQRPADMIEPLETALQLDPELPQAHLNLAYALELLGRASDAKPHVDWFLERFPGSVGGLRILALVERSLGHSDIALAAVRRALQRSPDNLDCQLLQAELLLFDRQPAAAYDALKPLDATWGFERRYLTLLLRAAVLSRQTEVSRKLQDRLQRLQPEFAAR